MDNKANNAFYDVQFKRLQLMQAQNDFNVEFSEKVSSQFNRLIEEYNQGFNEVIKLNVESSEKVSSQFNRLIEEYNQGFNEVTQGINNGFKGLMALSEKIFWQVVEVPSVINSDAKLILVLLAELRSKVLLDTKNVTVDSTNTKLSQLRKQTNYKQSDEKLRCKDALHSTFQELFSDVDGDGISNIGEELEKRLLSLMIFEKNIIIEFNRKQQQYSEEVDAS